MSNKTVNQAGFTLLEVVAALVLVGIAAAMMASVVTQSKLEGLEAVRAAQTILDKRSCAERLTADLVAHVGNLAQRREALLAHLPQRPDICTSTPSIVVEENGSTSGRSLLSFASDTTQRAGSKPRNEEWVDNHVGVCVPTSRDWPNGNLVIHYSCFKSTVEKPEVPSVPGSGSGSGSSGSAIRIEIDGIQMEVMP